MEQSDLQSKDSFIIDNGAFGLWVWVGKKASSAERTEAMRNAQGFIKKKGNHLCSTLIFSSWTSQKNIGWVVVPNPDISKCLELPNSSRKSIKKIFTF